MEQKVRGKYSDEFKREAVDLISVHGYGIAEAARNLDINAGMLGRWKRELERSGEHAFPGKGNMSPKEAELHQLRELQGDVFDKSSSCPTLRGQQRRVECLPTTL